MLNNPTITKTTLAGPGNQFLINSMPQKAVGCRVAAASANGTDSQGRAIVKMGTPLTGDLTDRQVAMTQDTTAPIGLLIHDVPVWDGDANGSLLIDGGIVLEYADEDIQTLIEATPFVTETATSTIKVVTRK